MQRIHHPMQCLTFSYRNTKDIFILIVNFCTVSPMNIVYSSKLHDDLYIVLCRGMRKIKLFSLYIFYDV